MAFGLSPKYVRDIQLDGLTHEQFLILAIEAAGKLGWNIGYSSEAGFMAYTGFSMSSWSKEIKVTIKDGVATLKSECTGSQLMDWGKNKGNIESLMVTFGELKNTLTGEELQQKYAELKPNLSSEDALAQTPLTTKGKLASFISLFTPAEGYFITPVLINLNIAVFILMVICGVNAFLPDNESLINWGANFRPVTLEGEWWRLITCCFLHIGILHLLMNMYALLYIGMLLEPYLGKTRFAAAYLLTGIAASITSLWWHDLTISAGASGAIFGMYGVFLAMLTTNLIEKSARQSLLASITVFVGYNLLNGMKGGVDNAAHIGGLISGLVIGYAYYPSLKQSENQSLKITIISILSVLVFAITFTIYAVVPNDIVEYDEKMKSFVNMESMALEVYEKQSTASREELLAEITDRGLYYWNENIKLVTELDKLNLPDEIHERNKKLIHYCDLRIQSYQVIYKAIKEDSNQYDGEIADYNKQIEASIEELKGK